MTKAMQNVLRQYLRETTVHGLRYLIEGRNWFEVAVWGIVITLGFTLSLAGVYTSINDSFNNPLLTSIQITQIQNVSKMHYFLKSNN